MIRRVALVLAAVLATAVAPASAVQNANWQGKAVFKLKWQVEDPVNRAHRKGKENRKFPDSLVVGQEAVFVQRLSEGNVLRGNLSTTDGRRFTTDAEGLEDALRGFFASSLADALATVDAAGAEGVLEYDVATLAGSFKLNKPQTSARGAQLLTFSTVLPVGEEEGRVFSGTIKVSFKGKRQP